jgi:Domain of unknown function (DUF4258)
MFHSPTLTNHAAQRCQQRGIDESVISTVIHFGEKHHAQGGMKAYFMSRRAISKARERWDMDLSDFRDVAVIVSADHHVVTVQYCPAPKKSWTGRK